MTMPPPLPCGRCRSAIEIADLRCPVCFLAVPNTAGPSDYSVHIQILRCRSCGAAMKYGVKAQAPQCAFCGGVLAMEELIDPQEEVETRLSFTVDQARATEVYQQWIARQGFFTPINLASTARLESLRPLWWAGWVVDADALITWTADSDADARKAKWAPHSGEFQSEFNGLVIPATRGLSALECAGLIPTYSVTATSGEFVDLDQDATQERFDMPRSFARAQIVGAIQRLVETRIKSGQIPGSRFRNLHSSLHLRRLVTRRMAFPAYVVAYRYRGRLYRTVISGQDANCVIGEAPRSMAKLILILLLAFLGLGALAMALLGR